MVSLAKWREGRHDGAGSTRKKRAVARRSEEEKELPSSRRGGLREARKSTRTQLGGGVTGKKKES